MDALPRAKQGVASAVNDAAREVGAAVGIAVVGSAFTAGYRGRIADVLVAPDDHVAAVMRDSPAAGLEIAARLPSAHASIDAIQLATIAGWKTGMAAAAAMLALGAVFVYARK